MGQGSSSFRGLTPMGTVSHKLDQRETRGVVRRPRLSVIPYFGQYKWHLGPYISNCHRRKSKIKKLVHAWKEDSPRNAQYPRAYCGCWHLWIVKVCYSWANFRIRRVVLWRNQKVENFKIEINESQHTRTKHGITVIVGIENIQHFTCTFRKSGWRIACLTLYSYG